MGFDEDLRDESYEVHTVHFRVFFHTDAFPSTGG